MPTKTIVFFWILQELFTELQNKPSSSWASSNYHNFISNNQIIYIEYCTPRRVPYLTLIAFTETTNTFASCKTWLGACVICIYFTAVLACITSIFLSITLTLTTFETRWAVTDPTLVTATNGHQSCRLHETILENLFNVSII